ncbi:hypothetical protein B0T26DRAFT_679196 [Lasiosphaeria miniovina]|uniref:CFEM domain-containing protein n=1 Tax=Lasiosphaeria miniovina TaxID=1954250 RepID=A0AA40A616_9PEZI|nr:uncharacterized protein B0T26DRAFT_679196 [Lasiosphaeria miniovina]KAK0709831.1 hypothetical protein B0T26DRAFT_679196 [Lasiosphaeria miniovina]
MASQLWQIKCRQLVLLAFTLSHVFRSARAQSAAPTSSAIVAVGHLPICAQTCITAAFSFCHCPLGDFSCFCRCADVAAFAGNCTSLRCTTEQLSQAARDALDVICPKPAAPSSTTSFTTSSMTPPRPTTTVCCGGGNYTNSTPTSSVVTAGGETVQAASARISVVMLAVGCLVSGTFI